MQKNLNSVLIFCFILFCSLTYSQNTPAPALPKNAYNNAVIFDFLARKFQFNYSGADGALSYSYEPTNGGTFAALTCISDNNYTFLPSSSGGLSMDVNNTEIVPWTSGVSFVLRDVYASADTLFAKWNMTYGSDSLIYTYKFHIEGRTLVIGTQVNSGKARSLFLDRCENAISPLVIGIPYLPFFNVLYSKDVFTTMYFDWEATRASEINPTDGVFSASSVYFSQTANYNLKSDGTRNKLSETIYLTTSPTLTDVLPSVPNPVSPLKAVTSQHLLADVWGDPFANSWAVIQQYNNLGVKNLWILNHVWQNAGYDNGYPNVLPAAMYLGGDAALKAFADSAAAHNYLFGLHENYVDFYPNAAVWDPADVALNSDGTQKKAWYNSFAGIQSYEMKPSRASYYLNLFSPAIRTNYGTTSSFLDVHSSTNPGWKTDYDASTLNAGSFKQTMDDYRSLFTLIRTIQNGPVSGEGYYHFLMAGYIDDVEAEIRTAKSGGFWEGSRLPLLVDFQLLKLHDLMCSHGVGYYERFFSDSTGSSNYNKCPTDSALIYMATELAYGQCGFIPNFNQVKDPTAVALLEYLYILPAQRLVASANPVSILYYDDGVERSASDYIKLHPLTFSNYRDKDFMSQVKIEYDNGTIICVNRNPSKSLQVAFGKAGDWYDFHATINGIDSMQVGTSNLATYTLPKNSGWLVYSPQNPVTALHSEPNPTADLIAYPNPFERSCVVRYKLAAKEDVTIFIYNLYGHLIKKVSHPQENSGVHEFIWNGKNDLDQEVPVGTYVCKLNSKSNYASVKILLLK